MAGPWSPRKLPFKVRKRETGVEGKLAHTYQEADYFAGLETSVSPS